LKSTIHHKRTLLSIFILVTELKQIVTRAQKNY